MAVFWQLFHFRAPLRSQTNNMGQTFGMEKQFHVHTTLEALVHTTLFLNNYVIYIYIVNK